jgi:2-dehydro-3-deoxyphosphooctonate aldolase (KDO 8-P synthase)
VPLRDPSPDGVASIVTTAVGVAGLFIETHQDPDNAPSDGPCMLRLDSLELLLTKLKKFDEIAKNLK